MAKPIIIPGGAADGRDRELSFPAEMSDAEAQAIVRKQFNPAYQDKETQASGATQETPTGQPSAGIPTPIEGAGAGFMGNLKAGMVNDPATKNRLLGKSLFPNDPNASQRMGTINQRPVYVGNDEKYYYADSGIGSKLGGAASYAPEAIGSAAGTMATLPAGPGAPVAGSILGDVFGRGLKRIIGGTLLQEPQTSGEVAGDLAKEAGIATVGAGLGKLGAVALNRQAIKGAESVDRAAIDSRIADVKNKTGIALDFTQAADSPRLRAVKRFASEFPNEAMDIAEKVKNRQTAEIADSITQRLMPSLTGETDRQAMAKRGMDAAQMAILEAKNQRTQQTERLYDAALNNPNPINVQPVLNFLDGQLTNAKGGSVNALQRVRNLLERTDQPAVGNHVAPETRIRALHNAKLQIDADLDAAAAKPGSANASTVRALTRAKELLLTQMENVSSEYKGARIAFEKISQDTVDPLEKGIVGVIARIKSPNVARSAATVMNDLLKSPETVAAVKRTLSQQDPEAWDSLVRISVENAFDKAFKTTAQGGTGNVAGKFRQAMIGTPRQKDALTMALGPQKVVLFNDVLDALDTISRDLPANSATMQKALIAGEQADKATPILKKAAGAISTAINPLSWSEALSKMATLENTGQAAKQFAEALQDPAKVEALKQLRRLKPGAERSLLTASVLFGSVGADQTGDALTAKPTQVPAKPRQRNQLLAQ